MTPANLALVAMRNNDDFPEGIKFMSAKTLTKGDIVFDMDSPESAEWLRKDGVQMSFLQGLGPCQKSKTENSLA